MTATRRLKRLHRFLVPPESEQGWTAYLWLVYLGFFFIEWFFRPVSDLELTLGLFTVAVFLVLYFSAFRRRGAVALWHIVAILVLAVAWGFHTTGSSVLFIYAAAFAFLVGRPPKSVWVLFAIAAIAAATAWLAQPIAVYWAPGVFISLIIGAANIYSGEQARRNAELRLTQAEVRRLARVAERERIARDLHDVLGHTLSMIAVKSELAERLVDQDPEAARTEVRSMGQTAREALADVRQAISGYQQQSLDESIEHVRLSLRAADIDAAIEIEEVDLSPRTQAMLALVIREAATNIIRHSGARNCRIALASEPDAVSLSIRDDGSGRIRMDGNGVQGMRARIESLGGRLDIGREGPASLQAHIPKEAA